MIVAYKLGCGKPMASLAALNSIQGSIYERPANLKHVADTAKEQWSNPKSDHITQLNALYAFARLHTKVAQGQLKAELIRFCRHHFLNLSALEEVLKIRRQILRSTNDLAQRYSKLAENAPRFPAVESHDLIRQALAKSFFRQSALLVAQSSTDRRNERYSTVHWNQPTLIGPDSRLLGGRNRLVVYTALRESHVAVMQTVTAIEPDWIKVSSSPFPLFRKLTVLRTCRTLAMHASHPTVVRHVVSRSFWNSRRWKSSAKSWTRALFLCYSWSAYVQTCLL
jgi:pre-mRNA-splicing factor ATP-dependent RNA helicase DHX15/PRP43